MEVKGLIAVHAEVVQFSGLEIPIEIWSKWSAERLSFDKNGGIALLEKRWLRRFEIAQTTGCNVE